MQFMTPLKSCLRNAWIRFIHDLLNIHYIFSDFDKQIVYIVLFLLYIFTAFYLCHQLPVN